MKNSEYEKISDEELLGKIVSEKSAKELLEKHKTLEALLLKSYRQELEQVKGVGSKTSSRIKAVGEAVSRVMYQKSKKVEYVKSAEDAYELCKDMVHLDQEEVRVILLNTKNRVKSVETVTIGTISSSVVTPREVYSRAVRAMAKAIILVHNHPSGEPDPSFDDKEITSQMKEAGQALNIEFLDHIVVAKDGYVSLKRETNSDLRKSTERR